MTIQHFFLTVAYMDAFYNHVLTQIAVSPADVQAERFNEHAVLTN